MTKLEQTLDRLDRDNPHPDKGYADDYQRMTPQEWADVSRALRAAIAWLEEDTKAYISVPMTMGVGAAREAFRKVLGGTP